MFKQEHLFSPPPPHQTIHLSISVINVFPFLTKLLFELRAPAFSYQHANSHLLRSLHEFCSVGQLRAKGPWYACWASTGLYSLFPNEMFCHVALYVSEQRWAESRQFWFPFSASNERAFQPDLHEAYGWLFIGSGAYQEHSYGWQRFFS